MSLPVLSCGLQERRVALGRLETLRVGAKSARLATPWAGSRPQNVAVLCLKRLEVDGHVRGLRIQILHLQGLYHRLLKQAKAGKGNGCHAPRPFFGQRRTSAPLPRPHLVNKRLAACHRSSTWTYVLRPQKTSWKSMEKSLTFKLFGELLAILATKSCSVPTP